MTKPNLGELIFFWVLFGAVGLLAFAIMSPYFTPVFLAGIFAVLFSPLYRRFLKHFPGNETLAAFLTVLLVLCGILLPLVFLGILLFQDVFTLYSVLTKQSTVAPFIDQTTNAIEMYVRNFVPSFTIHGDPSAYLERVLTWIAVNLNSFFAGIFSFFFQLILVLVTMFFFFRDGKKLRAFAVKISPLADAYDEGILIKLERAISSVVKGALLTATIQGFLVGLGFAVFGMPNPVLWGSVGTVAALIPVVGTGIITIPTSIYLLLTHQVGAGIGFIGWAFFAGIVDTLLRPLFLKRGMDVHPFFIFLSVLGGLAYFGPIGFLAGPIVLAFFFALLEIYPMVIKGRGVKED